MKRLIILCDGTWNRADQKRDGQLCPTNVKRLHQLILEGQTPGGVIQKSLYQRGVGNERFKRIRGGAFGLGLSGHIRDVYTWLCQEYDPGDEIFLFGFSRGAYTARSTVGMIRACGLVRREAGGDVPAKLVKDAYDVYRNAPKDGPGPDYPEAKAFREQHAVEERTPIRCIGVWDTVGALGIPLSGARWAAFNKRDEFHDVTLSSAVQAAYHALAIDEHRGPFTPALWQQSPDREQLDLKLEQVWFPGAHSDVGGGYKDHRLSDLTLRWMVGRAQAEGLVVDPNYVPAPDDPDHTTLSKVHDSRTWLYRRLRAYDRVLGVADPKHEWVSYTTQDRVARTASNAPELRYEPPGLMSYLSPTQFASLNPPLDRPGGGPPSGGGRVALEEIESGQPLT